jgi:hypothetical protein
MTTEEESAVQQGPTAVQAESATKSMKRILSTDDFAKTPLPKHSETEFGMTESLGNYFSFSENKSWEGEVNAQIEKNIVEAYKKQKESFTSFEDALPLLREGVEAVVKDSFTECFRPTRMQPWNWNPLLFVMWCLGVAIRYCILFPLRYNDICIFDAYILQDFCSLLEVLWFSFLASYY